MIFAKPLLILSMLIGTLQAQHQLKQTQEWQREQQKQHKQRKGTQQQKLPQQFLLPHQRAQLPPGVGDDASGEEAGKREMTVRMPVKYTAMQENLEVVFTLAISAFYFREKINRLEFFGIAVIVAGVLMFLL